MLSQKPALAYCKIKVFKLHCNYLLPVEDSLTNSLFVMGTTFWINTC